MTKKKGVGRILKLQQSCLDQRLCLILFGTSELPSMAFALETTYHLNGFDKVCCNAALLFHNDVGAHPKLNGKRWGGPITLVDKYVKLHMD